MDDYIYKSIISSLTSFIHNYVVSNLHYIDLVWLSLNKYTLELLHLDHYAIYIFLLYCCY